MPSFNVFRMRLRHREESEARPPHDRDRDKIEENPFYVVISGTIPGIYSDPAQALNAIRNVPNAGVRSFETFDAAVTFWQHVLRIHAVHVILAGPADVVPRPLPRPQRRYLKPTRIALCSYEIKGPGPILYTDELRKERFCFESDEKNNDDQEGVKWVVINGRRPGIYNSWPNAHRQIHGLKNPWEAYERVETRSYARSIFEACAFKGFVIVEELYPRILAEDDLDSCTKCLYQKDVDFAVVNI